jgi:hypothetical protein
MYMASTPVRKRNQNLPIPVEVISSQIYLIRGQKVMLDSHLAGLYQVPTKSLNLAVRRNVDRFPEDFMFQLEPEELGRLRFQFATSKGRGGRRYLPYAFTEQGVAMLSSVLKSKRAVQINIAIMRAFVKVRQVLARHKDVARKLEEIERSQKRQGFEISTIWETLKQLMTPKTRKQYRIGFKAG